VKATKPKIEQQYGICEYKPPSEMKKMIEEDYKQMFEVAVKIGMRKP